jgi:hypothetical protein
MKFEDLIRWLIPDVEECRKAAGELRLSDPTIPPIKVAEKAVESARKWAAGIGAATGITANPFTLLPAAAAEAIALLRIEGKMAGTVAALLDPPSLDDETAFRRDILQVVFPGAVSQALRKVGIRAGENAAKSLIKKYVTRGVVKEVGEHAAKRLGVRLTQKALMTKAVPLIGAGIGASWNWVEIQAIGKRAIRYHSGAPSAADTVKEKVKVFVRRHKPRARGK